MPETKKRVRPRPHQITVDLTEDQRTKLDWCVEKVRLDKKDPFFSASQLIRDIIDATYTEMIYTKITK